MWAQLMTMRLKPGKEGELPRLMEEIRKIEQPGSGLVRSTAMQDTKDPRNVYVLIVFESEQAARARESDPKRQEGMAPARAMMADIFEGPPEFVDLNVADEHA